MSYELCINSEITESININSFQFSLFIDQSNLYWPVSLYKLTHIVDSISKWGDILDMQAMNSLDQHHIH